MIVGNGDVIGKGSLLVEGKKILGVGRDIRPEDAEVVDCSGKILMPGLIDVHVHIALFAGEVNWDHLANINDDYLAVRAYTYLSGRCASVHACRSLRDGHCWRNGQHRKHPVRLSITHIL